MDELERVIMKVLESDEVYAAAKAEIQRRELAKSSVTRVVPTPSVKTFLLACPCGHTIWSETNLVRGVLIPCGGKDCKSNYIWSYSHTDAKRATQ